MPRFLVAHTKTSRGSPASGPTFEIVAARDDLAALKNVVLRLTGGRVPRYNPAEHACFGSARTYVREMLEEIAEANALAVRVERISAPFANATAAEAA
ncbi:MAG TPA: hypothetical protein P5256_01375 [Beijerinckiaceae bacterium]|nr:hypothetical protein [Rhodoblastus sp.]MCB1533407.1 hypothetical protein [Rhodoblastus sp.]MCC2106128.1 hypothetical protein [Hyphomicrobiales bacterium]HRY01747.1 hypothetical protein [Beijerinckiaceae bacterium]